MANRDQLQAVIAEAPGTYSARLAGMRIEIERRDERRAAAVSAPLATASPAARQDGGESVIGALSARAVFTETQAEWEARQPT
jgi:hypothetical protein